ncbi:MAG TPA: PIG-L family deacetylase [Chloroflexia bacterium]|nr:PIG-L family deacetylase [Chloroflexia bacterium]
MADLALLGVYAHPDDEQGITGALAKAAQEGIRTGLICATRGELGEISDPALATPDNLGEVREAEMRAAAEVAHIQNLWFLDYRDSGMMGTPGNDDPKSFYRVNDDEALAKLVKIIRDFKPTVMVTFDETGGYGHPDHITIHRLTTQAFDAAADPKRYPEAGDAWATSRLYYASFPRSVLTKMADWLKGQDYESGFSGVDFSRMGLDDSRITNMVDVAEWVPLKGESLSKHQTQMNPNSPFNKIPEDLLAQFRSQEYYALAAGQPLPEGEDARGDLFAGLR